MSLPQLTRLLRWQNRWSGPAHTLLRAFHDPATRETVVIVSELADNPTDRGITGDFPSVADAALPVLRRHLSPDLGHVVWIAHFGDFSSYDPGGPETFTRMDVTEVGGVHQENLHGHEPVTAQEVTALLKGHPLAPVPEILTRLGYQR
ncbi:hypothetical protein ACIBAI_03960 [Streptomyces sp. NPDC051041]|uniref:hypothetical protein n=1 Tax=Streptomyces sp. NPDC051041 TaxID=3365640 RepID=UPI0037B82966